MRSKSANWVKRNLTIPRQEAAALDGLTVATESSSHSEVVRQALRFFEQMMDDEEKGESLFVKKPTGETVTISSQILRDESNEVAETIRRSLILHDKSYNRLLALEERMGADDESEVVRCALRFYERIVDEAGDGGRFFVGKRDGEMTEVRLGSFSKPASADSNKKARNSEVVALR